MDDLRQSAGGERFHLERRLLRFDLGYNVAALDGVPDHVRPCDDATGPHVITELGHADRDSSHAFLPANKLIRDR